MYKDVSKLLGAGYVDYNDDRLVFYPTSGYQGSPDYLAAVSLLCLFYVHASYNVTALTYSMSATSPLIPLIYVCCPAQWFRECSCFKSNRCD
jgi:hypothetical protein